MGLFGFGKKKEISTSPEIFEKMTALITEDEAVRRRAAGYFLDPAAYYTENKEDLDEHKVAVTEANELSWRAMMAVLVEAGVATDYEDIEVVEDFQEQMGKLAARLDLPYDPKNFSDELQYSAFKDPTYNNPDLFYDILPDDSMQASLIDWLEELNDEWGEFGYAVGTMRYNTRSILKSDRIIVFAIKAENTEELKKLAKETGHKAGDAYACW